MLRISGPPPANFQPARNQTVTIGDYTWTWGQITNDTTLATAGDYANALTGWISSHTDAYTASTVFSGSGANVQLLSRAVGTAGNVTISSTNTTITTTGTMYGGLDGSAPATTGRIYGKGTSNLRLGTSIKGTVLSAAGTTVSLRLRWFDDSGVQHTQDVDLPKSGDDNSVEVTGMGGLRIYRDSANFHEGAVFTLDVGHYQGNDETLSVNYSESGGRLAFNYTARQILGDNETVSLMDARAAARNNSGDGAVKLTGAYRGLKSRQITFDVLDGGQVPGDNVTFRVSWIGDDGLQHSEEAALRGVGPENGVVLPLTGVRPKVDLTGVTPTANPANTGSGVVHFDGTYRGLGARDFNLECINDGSAPGADLTLRVTWIDDKAVRHQEDVAVPQSAIDNKVEIPGSDGVYLYVDDENAFQVGDRYEHKIAMYPDKAGEGVFFHIDNGSFTQGDSFFQKIEKDLVHVLDTLKEWRYQLANGTREQGQTQSQRSLEALDKQLKSVLDYVAGAGARQDRIKVRKNVLTENKLYASKNLEEFQDVDVTKAFLDMRSMQTAYSAALKSISMMTQMSLLTQM
jgi:flagellar hook-associated protein 3 FlgL